MTKKILILIVLVIALILAITAFNKKPEVDVPVVIQPDTTATSTDIEHIDSTVPTEPNYTLYGKYTTYEVTKYGIDYDATRDPKPKTETCTAFTVSGGDAENISKYISRVKNGNTVNRLDKDGNLVLNIKPEQLSLSDRQILVNSSSTVTLHVKNNPPGESDGFYCGSFVTLVSLEK